MLSLLTFLLPVWAPKAAVDFHADLTINVYREFYDQFEATGYRNRELLSQLKTYTRYSMRVLFWQRPLVWWHVVRFRRNAWNLKKAITPLEKASETLPMP